MIVLKLLNKIIMLFKTFMLGCRPINSVKMSSHRKRLKGEGNEKCTLATNYNLIIPISLQPYETLLMVQV